MEFEDGVIEDWQVVESMNGHVVYGCLYYDRKNRFEDGTWIKSSRILSDIEGLVQGDKLETLNSFYVLGVPLEDDYDH